MVYVTFLWTQAHSLNNAMDKEQLKELPIRVLLLIVLQFPSDEFEHLLR